ncbi:MAG: toll/interleukin-1 receptor domain-containing protein [Cyanobacteria bacterium P01_A01_bin.135]
MTSIVPSTNPSNYFAHTLLRARDWQHRPEFDRVCDWWRDGGSGVCALVGMGGAGKTAIVERFLRVLPGVLPPSKEVAKDEALPRPNSTFVFSFYDAPNAEAFFEALHLWLMQSPNVGTMVSYSQLLFLMQNAVPGLIILDGLEKVQEDGIRGVLGRLSAPNLRDFVSRAANGYFPKLSLLITTRFPLADLQETQPEFFQSIPIEEVDLPTGVRLLRQRGVRGNDLELERIVQECGNHALTVDLAGGYIKEYGDGDPDTPLALGTAAELEQEAAQEQDPAKRAVLKQGFRFARVAQRYQEAMLESDPGAIALLERICLFRLGVEAATLAAIFTGEGTVKVSGEALAGLGSGELQQKLDWLVRMRIVEQTVIRSRKSGETRILYDIHPAVRDGFFRGIGRDVATASHGAIRTGLEVSLGEAPGENPSDPATLDLLEEIVYHAIASGQVEEAWSIYWYKIGSYQNLGWRLGAYERGERICRAFGGGESPKAVAAVLSQEQQGVVPCLSLSEHWQAIFLATWALYLLGIGRLDAAAHCFEANIVMQMQLEDWKNASIGNRSLSDVWQLAGRSRLALTTAGEALRLAEHANDGRGRQKSYATQANAHNLRGTCKEALDDFRNCLHWQNQVDGNDNPLYSLPGIWYALLLTRLGRHDEVCHLTEANKEILAGFYPTSYSIPKCNLILADLTSCSKNLSIARNWYESSQNWALARDAKEVLCWATLIKTRIELADFQNQNSEFNPEPAQAALTEGLKIARDCGYGIYHIDLLIEQARLHLLQSNPQAALATLRLALDDGSPASDTTGQPQLLAATDPECHYAWGIAEGLHRRAEALLLQAAQLQGSKGFIPAEQDALSNKVQGLITEAEACLDNVMDHWRKLRDPEVRESNFIHPENGEEYNYRAEETYGVITDLRGGLLTRYPVKAPEPPAIAPASQTSAAPIASPRAFISYSQDSDEHTNRVVALSQRLRDDGIDCWIDQYDPNPPEGWPLWMSNQLDEADFVLVLFTERYTTRSLTPGQSGVRFESVLLLQELYEAGMINSKFIPTVFDSNDVQYIMRWLKPFSHYVVGNDEGYEQLRRRLLDDPATPPPPLGTPVRRGPRR